MAGTLYVVATPIGNMEDITLRAVRILSEVDGILCEDTRQTAKLLNRYEIKKPLTSYYSYNEQKVSDSIIDRLDSGEDLALVSDSGTPGVSDPGQHLVKEAGRNGITVVPIPGASAVISLLSVSGFSGGQFCFGGFLSIKKGKRIKKLEELKQFKGIIVLYESPHRILKLIEEMAEVFPDQAILIGRELTKKFEELIRGTSTEILENKDQLKIKGEYTILIDNFSIA